MMSSKNFNFANPADMVELVPHVIGHHPYGNVVVIALDQELDSPGAVLSPIPARPADWRHLAGAMTARAAQDARIDAHHVILAVCPDETDAAGQQWYAPLGAEFAAACARRHLALTHSLFMTTTHWWHLTGNGTFAGAPLPGTPRRIQPSPTAGEGEAATGACSTGVAGGTGGTAPAEAWTRGPVPGETTARHAVERALADLGRELAAGHGTTRRQLLALLDQALRPGDAQGEGAMGDDLAARVLVAVQNGPLFDAAAELCEIGDLARAQELWARAAWLCVDPYRMLAAAPLNLLALTELLAGDLSRARAMVLAAMAAKPGDATAERLSRILDFQEARVLTRGMDAVALLHRDLRSGRARLRAERD
ncbi:DUF4192 domain-containing protein [Kitasatospora sp. NBC_01560]|uniref:DUF4192 family protein n=1 Tax=Kitasatospora sp. NBC_01560 TaxID=2975965 RepID=UPI0038638BBE